MAKIRIFKDYNYFLDIEKGGYRRMDLYFEFVQKSGKNKGEPIFKKISHGLHRERDLIMFIEKVRNEIVSSRLSEDEEISFSEYIDTIKEVTNELKEEIREIYNKLTPTGEK